MMTKQERDAALLEIARKTLEIETLQTQNADRYDFHELAVWTIKKALEQAFEAGERSMNTPTTRKAADLSKFDLRATAADAHEFLVERKPKGCKWAPRFENQGMTIEAETKVEALEKAAACDESCWG